MGSSGGRRSSARWAVLVVMPPVDAEHVFEMSATENEDPVDAVGADGSHPAFGVGIRVWRLDGRADHLDALAAEDFVEGVAELLVAIVDEESESLVVSQLHDEVACLLRDPGTIWACGAGDVLDPACCERDEEEDVEPLEEHRLDREGSQASALAACCRRKRPPRLCSLRRRRQTGTDQHLAHRGRGDGDAETLQLTDDPPVPPSGDSHVRVEGSACATKA